MLIRTQNKMCVCNLKNMEGISIGNTGDKKKFFLKMRFSSERSDNCALGEYQTEERAIEVLDEICENYQYIKVGETVGVGMSEPQYVFQMPEV